jgi:hypothetical protein
MQRAINEAAAPRDLGPNKLLTAPTAKGRPIDPIKEERTDRRREELERRQIFERLHAEAGRRLRALRPTGRRARGPIGAGDGITPLR